MDLYPARCYFTDENEVDLYLSCSEILTRDARVSLEFFHMGEKVYEDRIDLKKGKRRYVLSLHKNMGGCFHRKEGYLATCTVTLDNSKRFRLQTAFMVIEKWQDYPLYGFLSDFQPEREDAEATVEELLKFHINGLQFYDWQYRHDRLVPDRQIYQDVLGRQMSAETIRQLIESAHHYGMACMPYLAVYAASLPYWKKNKDQALYDRGGKEILFHDFLGLMNPSKGSKWSAHLANECKKIFKHFSFDGLHIDQYGEPKVAYDSEGLPVDLPRSFTDFINHEKKSYPEKAVVFNAVGNWPIEALCESEQDFMYIEIWPPAVHYQDLVKIIKNAQIRSGYKPVVLAMYMPVSSKANILLSDALIYASGASRIEIGEHCRYLSDPYFPKHSKIPSLLYTSLRRYYDFACSYFELLILSKREEDFEVTVPPDVIVFLNSTGNKRIIQLININQIPDGRWDRRHGVPQMIRDFQIKVYLKSHPQSIKYASPDGSYINLRSVEYEENEDGILITIPRLKYWTMVVIETEGS